MNFFEFTKRHELSADPRIYHIHHESKDLSSVDIYLDKSYISILILREIMEYLWL